MKGERERRRTKDKLVYDASTTERKLPQEYPSLAKLYMKKNVQKKKREKAIYIELTMKYKKMCLPTINERKNN
jgi:hypothetical protein